MNEVEEKELAEFFRRNMEKVPNVERREFRVAVETQSLGRITFPEEPRRQRIRRAIGGSKPPPPTITSVDPDHGPSNGGQSVTINGTGFQTDVTVKWDATDQPIDSINADGTQIFLTTIAHDPQIVDVTVTNPTGLTDTLPNGYEFKPGPNIVSLEPTSGTKDGGTAVTVHGSNFATGMVIRFGLFSATGVVIVDSDTATCITPANILGLVDVQVVNTDGQQDTLPNAFTYGSGTSIVFQMSCNPHDLINGLLINVSVRAEDSSGGLVTGYNSSTCQISADYDPTALVVGTNPASGGAITFINGLSTFQVQAAKLIPVGLLFFNMDFLDSSQGIGPLVTPFSVS